LDKGYVKKLSKSETKALRQVFFVFVSSDDLDKGYVKKLSKSETKALWQGFF
jgi:hypothetical protein